MVGDGVVIHHYTTLEGSSITFTCVDGLFPVLTSQLATLQDDIGLQTLPLLSLCVSISLIPLPPSALILIKHCKKQCVYLTPNQVC